MNLMRPEYIVAVFLLAALQKLIYKKYDKAFSRVFVACWFLYLAFAPEVPVDLQRQVGRWALLQIAIVDVFGWLMSVWVQRDYTRALRGLHDDK